MDAGAPPVAPAQPIPETPVAPPTVSATRAAADAGDFAAFDTAHQAARRGTPLPRVEADVEEKPAASATPSVLDKIGYKPTSAATDGVRDEAAPATPERQLSKRQQDINDRAQRAVDAATADLRAENARLKAQLGEENERLKAQLSLPKASVPLAAPDLPQTPTWQRYAAMPDAPKLDTFDSIESYTAAMAVFIADTRYAERDADAKQQQIADTRVRELTDLGQQYGEKLRTAADADPTLVSKIDKAILAARPLSGLSPEELKTATFANAVAEAGLYSDNPAALYLHLSQHAADATRISQLPPAQWARALAHLDGRLGAAAPVAAAPPAAASTAAPPAAPTSSITAAPPPPQTVSRTGATSDPKAAALAQGDFATFDRLEMARKRAERGMPA